MPIPSLADLLPPPSLDEIKAALLAYFAVPVNPVTDWASGAVLRTMVELEALVIQDLVANAEPAVVANGFADSASDDSLAMTARYAYGVDRVAGAVATQVVTLACDALHGPYLIVPGTFLGKTTDGKTYAAASGGTLATGSTLTIDMVSLAPEAARGLVSTPLPALAGVTVQSAAIKVVSGVPQYGQDRETDPALLADCDSRFDDLDAVPSSEDRVITWTKEASAVPTRFRLDPDPTYAGGVLLSLADASGGVAGGVVTTVQAYIDERQPITDLVTAQAASNVTVNASGTVVVRAAQEAAVKAAAQAAWIAYLSTSKIGATVYLLQLQKAVMDAGAVDFTGAELNGVADDFTMSATQVPVSGGDLATALTWVVV